MNILSAIKSVRIFPGKNKLQVLTTPWSESLDTSHVLDEYPRPQMVRNHYINLNGYWDYKVYAPKGHLKSSGQLLVPFSPEAPLSGAGFQLKPNEILVCERLLPQLQPPAEGSRCILHFGAVDQYARVYINGHLAVSHIGGYLPFSADITEFLTNGDNLLSVRIVDRSDTSYHSIGKQKLKRGGMFYTAQSGIWQTVWLEWVPDIYIQDLLITPCFDKETVHVSLTLNKPLSSGPGTDCVLCRVLDAEGAHVSKGVCANQSDSMCHYSCYCDVDDVHPWTPDTPYLYSLEVTAGADCVTGYFAMRTFSIEQDSKGIPRFCLNHHPLLLNGVLDQGYWPDGLYTAPSDEALMYDIKKMKELGFNLIRKHVKIEPARWYYHCDRLGMIVWQDMVNGGKYLAPFMTWLPALFPKLKTHFSDRFYSLLGRKNIHGREDFERECLETAAALRSFPCISTWVLFNEGWGQFDSKRLTKKLKDMDSGRLIDSASGWFDRGQGDFKSEHNYFEKLSVIPDKRAFVISEYGGYACQIKEHISTKAIYGYKIYPTLEQFQNAYFNLRRTELEPLIEQGLCGAVYTQVSDIEDEINGLLTYDRRFCKLDS